MIFADKLIALRKKNGYTQEELAEKMDVSRQSIAKWEGAQSIPELSKIIKLSTLFGVSTDYLLKDEIDEIEKIEVPEGDSQLRIVDLEEASRYIQIRAKASRSIALGVMLCILSPVCLILLSGLREYCLLDVPNGLVVAVGMCILLLMVVAAVVLFIRTNAEAAGYEFLETEVFETAYGVDGMVKERKAEFKYMQNMFITIGTVICILSVVPIFIGLAFNDYNTFSDIVMIYSVCLTLVLVSIGVYLFVRCGIVSASYDKLLQCGDYTEKRKNDRKGIVGAVPTAYWLVVTALYLALSFTTHLWQISWLIWAIAGVLYPAVIAIVRAIANKKNG